jgi:hypothetical protein
MHLFDPNKKIKPIFRYNILYAIFIIIFKKKKEKQFFCNHYYLYIFQYFNILQL